jgi:hypothetical protein
MMRPVALSKRCAQVSTRPNELLRCTSVPLPVLPSATVMRQWAELLTGVQIRSLVTGSM